MNLLNENIKKYLLAKHTETKLKECKQEIEKNIPWIQRKNITNTIETHCKVLLNALNGEKQSYRRNKFIVDSILKYTIEKSEAIINLHKKTDEMKAYMQLNSYIVFDEISKGLSCNKNKKAIKYNIEKQLSLVQEKIDAKMTAEEILNTKIGA